MQFVPDNFTAKYIIRSYEAGEVLINDSRYRQNLIITASELIVDWQPAAFADVTREDLAPLLALDVDVLLIGTGEQQQFLRPALQADFIKQGIGVEVMNTAAACRTFNVSESRNVAAGLFLD